MKEIRNSLFIVSLILRKLFKKYLFVINSIPLLSDFKRMHMYEVVFVNLYRQIIRQQIQKDRVLEMKRCAKELKKVETGGNQR
jgi:hypothetical protein